MSGDKDAKVMFRGMELSTNKDGYRAPKKVYVDYMKDQGIAEDTLKTVLDAHSGLHSEILDFCAERVIAEDRPKVTLAIPAGDGITLDGTVQKLYERPGPKHPIKNADGVVQKDEEGNIVYGEPVPVKKWGRCEIGMTYELGKPWGTQRDRIAAQVEAAFS